jgi:hypothetical protein
VYVTDSVSGSISVVFSAAALYALTAAETGLPIGTQWYLNVTGWLAVGSTSTSASADLPNRTDQLEFNTLNLSFAPIPPSASVTVSGAPVGMSVAFQSVVHYSVSFNETGLPAGTLWYVNITHMTSLNSTGSTISTLLPNGSYAFTTASANGSYTPSPASGTVPVNGGSAYTRVSFSLSVGGTDYSVTLNESGLPNGSVWYFNLSGQPSVSSTTRLASVTLPNGSYSFTVAAADSLYGSSVTTSSFTIAGINQPISVTFALGLYPVTFTVSGLPIGSSWSARVSNAATGFAESQSSTTDTITFHLANGTYSVTFTWPPGYSGKASISEVMVDGRAIAFPTVPVAASTSTNIAAPVPPLGFPTAILAVAVVAIALLSAAVIWRSRRAPPRVGPTEPDEDPSAAGPLAPPPGPPGP